ncbi:MAG: hypothetical protein FWB82_05580 [Treponema sp.]|nr:hypothetical protein [Treponema sp.]
MKRIFTVIFLVMVCAGTAKAQMLVELGAITQGLLAGTNAERLYQYGRMIVQQTQSAANTYNQFQAALRAEQRAFNNLRGLQNVNSYAEFMAWYNRQIELERHSADRFNRMSIQVGSDPNNRISLAQIENLPQALSTTYGREHWDREFTPQQRRAMWMNLGLSPGNFTYLSAWGSREEDLGRRILLRRGVIDENTQWSRARDAETLAEISGDDVSENALRQAEVAATINTNNLLLELITMMAEGQEYQLVRDRLSDAPPEPLGLSPSWGQDFFPSHSAGRLIPFD